MDLGQVFYVESQEMLDEIISDLITAETGEIPEDFVGRLFRTFHSIKGGAAMLGYEQIEKLAHRLEDSLDEMRCSGDVPQGNQLTVIIDITYLIQEMITAQQQQIPGDFSQRANRLIEVLQNAMTESSAVAPLVAPATQPTAARKMTPCPLPPIPPAPATAQVVARSLYLVSCRIGDDAPMPEVTGMIVSRNLAERGTVIFASEHSSAAGWLGSELIYLVATDAGPTGMRSALSVSDVEVERIIPLKGGGASIAAAGLLDGEAVKEFNRQILKLMQILCLPGYHLVQMTKSVALLHGWLRQHGEELGAGVGHGMHWERCLDLLETNITLAEALRDIVVAKLMVTNNINSLWNQFFAGICERYYYFRLFLGHAGEIDTLDEVLLRRFGDGDFVHAMIDISAIPAQEMESRLTPLAALVRKWQGQGRQVSLIVPGENYPKYEILALAMAGGFPGGFYRSEFEAFLKVEGE